MRLASWSFLSLAHAISQRTALTTCRAQFLSSAAATVFTGAAVWGMDPEECNAAADATKNPRYIEKNLEMKYGEYPGTSE